MEEWINLWKFGRQEQIQGMYTNEFSYFIEYLTSCRTRFRPGIEAGQFYSFANKGDIICLMVKYILLGIPFKRQLVSAVVTDAMVNKLGAIHNMCSWLLRGRRFHPKLLQIQNAMQNLSLKNVNKLIDGVTNLTVDILREVVMRNSSGFTRDLRNIINRDPGDYDTYENLENKIWGIIGTNMENDEEYLSLLLSYWTGSPSAPSNIRTNDNPQGRRWSIGIELVRRQQPGALQAHTCWEGLEIRSGNFRRDARFGVDESGRPVDALTGAFSKENILEGLAGGMADEGQITNYRRVRIPRLI